MTQKELENTLYKLGKEAIAQTHAVRSGEWAEMCSALVSTSIDDMQVRNPIGFRGTTVKMTLWNSFVPKPMLEMIYESIEELDRTLVAVYPSNLALLEMMNNEQGSLCCIILDADHMTLIVREWNAPQWIQNIPIGCSGFFQKCMETFHTNPDTTRTLLSAWAQWQLQKADSDKIQSIFENEGEILLLALDVAFQGYEGTLPSRFLLCGMSGYILNLAQRLQDRHWEKRYTFSELPRFEIAPQWDPAMTEQSAALGGVIVSFQPQKKGSLARIFDRVSRLLSF